MSIAILAILAYLLAILFQGLRLPQVVKFGKGFLCCGLVAVFLHAFLLYQWIDHSAASLINLQTEQNLYGLNVFSFVCWLSSVLLLLAMIKKPVANLAMLSFGISAISISLVLFFPGVHFVNTSTNTYHIIHIVTSLFAFSIISIAVAQSFLFLLQDILLKKRQTAFFLSFFPPLQTMESMLFELIALGFVLLSFILVTSFLFYGGAVLTSLTHSPYLAFLAWLVFAILLAGRAYMGWRGRTAIRWTIAGASLLVLSFMGSWLWGLVRQFIG